MTIEFRMPGKEKISTIRLPTAGRESARWSRARFVDGPNDGRHYQVLGDEAPPAVYWLRAEDLALHPTTVEWERSPPWEVIGRYVLQDDDNATATYHWREGAL